MYKEKGKITKKQKKCEKSLRFFYFYDRTVDISLRHYGVVQSIGKKGIKNDF